MKDLRNKGKFTWKSITLISSMSVIGAMILAIIIMVCIPVMYVPKYNRDSIMDVTVLNTTTSYGVGSPADAPNKASEMLDELNKSLKTNSLNALFNGTLGKSTKPIYGASKSLDTLKSESTYVMRLSWFNPQTLNNPDGTTFKTNGNTVKYNYMYICLKEENKSFSKVDFYVSENDVSMQYYFVESYGNLSKLCNITKEYIKALLA